MRDEIPITPLTAHYLELAGKSKNRDAPKGTSYGRRLDKAKKFLDKPERLVEDFQRSVDEASDFFTSHPEYRDEPFYDKDKPRDLRTDITPGLNSTPSLCRWFEKRRSQRWEVLGDPRLSFYYLDRELVSTRAPGQRLAGGRSTRVGPRLDLLLANANDGTPIVGELKVTARKPGPATADEERVGLERRSGPDKDPFYGLIQGLASAAYLLPKNQLNRLREHEGKRTLDLDDEQLDVYVLIGDEPEASKPWFELRDYAERVSEAIWPEIKDQVRTIACLDLKWYPWRPAGSRLRITKRFAYPRAQV